MGLMAVLGIIRRASYRLRGRIASRSADRRNPNRRHYIAMARRGHGTMNRVSRPRRYRTWTNSRRVIRSRFARRRNRLGRFA